MPVCGCAALAWWLLPQPVTALRCFFQQSSRSQEYDHAAVVVVRRGEPYVVELTADGVKVSATCQAYRTYAHDAACYGTSSAQVPMSSLRPRVTVCVHTVSFADTTSGSTCPSRQLLPSPGFGSLYVGPKQTLRAPLPQTQGCATFVRVQLPRPQVLQLAAECEAVVSGARSTAHLPHPTDDVQLVAQLLTAVGAWCSTQHPHSLDALVNSCSSRRSSHAEPPLGAPACCC
jgi:hypothetical protein